MGEHKIPGKGGHKFECTYSNPYEAIANEIVIQAITDWKALVREKAWLSGGYIPTRAPCDSISFRELRNFFLSDWCDLLLTGTEMTGVGILTQLEDMFEAEKYGIAIKTWQKKKMKEKNK